MEYGKCYHIDEARKAKDKAARDESLEKSKIYRVRCRIERLQLRLKRKDDIGLDLH